MLSAFCGKVELGYLRPKPPLHKAVRLPRQSVMGGHGPTLPEGTGFTCFFIGEKPRFCRNHLTATFQPCEDSTRATWPSTLSSKSSINALCSGRVNAYQKRAVLIENCTCACVVCRSRQ